MDKKTDEYGWLVEGVEDGHAVWLCVSVNTYWWGRESSVALRFAREEDAQSMIAVLCKSLPFKSLGGLKATDHIWS